MRLIIIIFVLLFLGVLVYVQIIIECQDYIFEVGVQNKFWIVDFFNVIVLQDGEGVVWDFSGVVLEESFLVNYEVFLSFLFLELNIIEFLFGSFLGGFVI